MTRTLVGVGVVVSSADGRVLVAERRAERPLALALPGGKPEPGESIEECAVRELREETGLELDDAAVRTFGCVLQPGDPAWVVAGVHGTIARPAAEVHASEREPDKIGGFRWIDPAALPGNLYPASARLLALLAPA